MLNHSFLWIYFHFNIFSEKKAKKKTVVKTCTFSSEEFGLEHTTLHYLRQVCQLWKILMLPEGTRKFLPQIYVPFTYLKRYGKSKYATANLQCWPFLWSCCRT